MVSSGGQEVKNAFFFGRLPAAKDPLKSRWQEQEKAAVAKKRAPWKAEGGGAGCAPGSASLPSRPSPAAPARGGTGALRLPGAAEEP